MAKKKEEVYCKICNLPGKTKCTFEANCLNVSMAEEQVAKKLVKQFKRKNRNNILTLSQISLTRAYNKAVKEKKTSFSHKGHLYHTEFAKQLLEFTKEHANERKKRNGTEKTGHTNRFVG
jgi:hypothetical protein